MRYIAMCLLVLAGMFAAGCAREAAQTSIPQAAPTGLNAPASPILVPSAGDFLGGGDKKEARPTGVGVVDFPVLFQKLGYQQKIEDKLRDADQKLAMMRNEALKLEMEKQAKLQKDLDAAIKAVTKIRPDVDQETLMKDPAVTAAAKVKFEFETRVKKSADQFPAALETYKRSLQENLSAAVLPAMGKIGPGAGVQIIFGKHQVAWNSGDVDLTAAMEEYLRTNSPDFKFAEPPDWKTIIVPMDRIPN